MIPCGLAYWLRIKKAHHFDVIDGYFYLYDENEVRKFGLEPNSPSTFYKVKNVYRTAVTGDTMHFYSVHENQVHESVRTSLIKKEGFRAWSANVVSVDGIKYYKDTFSTKQIPDGHFGLFRQDGKLILDLSKVVTDSYPSLDTTQTTVYTSGWLTFYAGDTLAYLYQQSDLVLLVNTITGKYRTITTNALYKYIPYKRITAKDPASGITFSRYEADLPMNGIHHSIAVNDNYIFIRPDFVYRRQKNEPYEMIDVYQKYTFKYLYSIPFSGLVNGESIFDVRCTSDAVYILTSKGKLYSTALPK